MRSRPIHSMNSKSEETSLNTESKMVSNNVHSGPSVILNEAYGVDDPVFLVGSEISANPKGDAPEVGCA